MLPTQLPIGLRPTRRAFLRQICLALAAAPLVSASEPQANGKRPNILFAIADDWGWPHASAYGDPVVKTPTFDGIAQRGILFNHAYAAVPSCTASRNALLTGQQPWRLGPGMNLWSSLPKEHPTFTNILEDNGYAVGSYRKIYGPGPDRQRPVAGKAYDGFEQFLDTHPEDQPFCFMFGTTDPHRGYRKGSGVAAGLDPSKVKLPSYLPDTPEVRSDVCDYYFEVERFDREVGEQIALLKKRGLLDNTIVVMTSDHGWPFPRGKSNLYDLGTRVPLAIQWPDGIQGQDRVVDDFVNLTDFAPTFLQAAGLRPPDSMTGQSLIGIFDAKASGWIDPSRDHVITAKERHTPCQADSMGGTPMRAIRTKDYLYIRNYEPDRWPAGAPKSIRGKKYGDVDGSITKNQVIATEGGPDHDSIYALALGKRPAEELYRVEDDPEQIHNLSQDKAFEKVLVDLRAQLEGQLIASGDPRALGQGSVFDSYPYYSGEKKTQPKKK